MPIFYNDVKSIVPQFANRFEVKFEVSNEVLKSNITISNPSVISVTGNTFTLLTQTSITLPDITVETLEIPNPSFNVKQQSSITFGDEITISVVEGSDFCIRNMFEKWLSLVYDYINITQAPPSIYKQDKLKIILYQQLISNQDETISVYEFYNVYPISVQGNDLDYSNTDLITRDITFKYDYYSEILFNKFDLLKLTQSQ